MYCGLWNQFRWLLTSNNNCCCFAHRPYYTYIPQINIINEDVLCLVLTT
jgi:hypothetical protein